MLHPPSRCEGGFIFVSCLLGAVQNIEVIFLFKYLARESESQFVMRAWDMRFIYLFCWVDSRFQDSRSHIKAKNRDQDDNDRDSCCVQSSFSSLNSFSW